MLLSAIRGKISQLPRFRKMLLAILLTIGALAIIFILVEVIVFFYFGYYRQKIPDQGLNTQVWFKGERLNLISGTIVEKQGTVVTVEKNGEQLELDLGNKVFYCGEKEEKSCRLLETSEIKVGQLIVAHTSRKWEENPKLNLILGTNMRIHIWDN